MAKKRAKKRANKRANKRAKKLDKKLAKKRAKKQKRDKKGQKGAKKGRQKGGPKYGPKIKTICYFMSPGHGFNFPLRHTLIHGLLNIWTGLLYLTFPHEADILTLIMSHKLTPSL